jgi:hypothetical protein
MQAETGALGHCVGDSDFYIEKVRDKKILVLSLRNAQGNPQYTLEYDIKTQTLKQFRGKDNKLPDDDSIITTTLDAIVQAGYPIRQYNEALAGEKSLIYDREAHSIETGQFSLAKLINVASSQGHILK